MNTLGLAAICGLAACAAAGSAAADTQHFDHDAWHLSVDVIDTGEDLRTTCRIHTGGDGAPTLSLEISDGDAGPPDYFPDVQISENAPRGHDTVMQDGARVGFLTERGQSFDGEARRWIDEEGFVHASAIIDQDRTQEALQAMAADGLFEIHSGGRAVTTAMFHGFADAYAHMMTACGFTARGVIAQDAPKRAETLHFDYRDWHVVIEDLSDANANITLCTAYTGGDGAPTLRVAAEMTDQDGQHGPPPVSVSESPPRGHDSVIRDGADVHLIFEDKSGVGGKGRRWIDEDGFVQARMDYFDPKVQLPLLRAMRRMNRIDVIVGDRRLMTASLAGFTAAYGKIAEQCRFPAADVID